MCNFCGKIVYTDESRRFQPGIGKKSGKSGKEFLTSGKGSAILTLSTNKGYGFKRKEDAKDETHLGPAAAQQYSMWTNAVFPGNSMAGWHAVPSVRLTVIL